MYIPTNAAVTIPSLDRGKKWVVKEYKLNVITSEFSFQFYHIIASGLTYLSLIHLTYVDKIYPKDQGIVKFCLSWLLFPRRSLRKI